jgi:hypothetical protein
LTRAGKYNEDFKLYYHEYTDLLVLAKKKVNHSVNYEVLFFTEEGDVIINLHEEIFNNVFIPIGEYE